MKKRIKFIKGVLIPKVSEIYEVDALDINWHIKTKYNFESYTLIDAEQLDEIICLLDQMLLEKNYDINEDYYEKIKR
jgi:hypothetical protein